MVRKKNIETWSSGTEEVVDEIIFVEIGRKYVILSPEIRGRLKTRVCVPIEGYRKVKSFQDVGTLYNDYIQNPESILEDVK